MTQYAAAPPPTQPAPAPVAPAVVLPAGAGTPAPKTVVDTPKLLNQWQLIGVTVAILFGVVSALLQFLAWQSDGQAADDAEQLLRVQEIQSSLLRADALATNEFLVGGEGDPERRQEYDTAIADVLEQIAAAADAQPADEKALQALAVAINEYTTGVSEARVYARQGRVVGNGYLSEASENLRLHAGPILANLVDANTGRAEDAMGGQHPILLVLAGIAALAVLVWINQMLAGRFRRRINIGIAVAALIVLVITAASAAAAAKGDSQNDGLLDDELRTAIDNAAARTAGNDAKAYESLRLINQGSGGTNEPKWEAAAKVVTDRADGQVLRLWRAYAQGHARVVELDDTDYWFRAKNLATDDEEPEEGADASDLPPTVAFDRFDEAAQAVADENGDRTTDELRAGRTLALVGSLATLLLGVVAAIAVARGIAARRREYA